MEFIKEPRAEILEYGFLTSRTARVLSGCMKGKELDNENKLVLDQARNFMEKVLNGEALVSGQHSGLQPSVDGLNAFKYGIQAIIILRNRQEVSKVQDRSELRSTLSEIRDALACLIEASPSIEQDKCKELDFAAKFFGAIADSLSSQARRSFLVQPSSL